MWYGPVTSCAWFNTYNGKPAHSKAAYAEKRPHRRTVSETAKSLLPTAFVGATPTPLTEKPERRATTRSNRDRNSPTTAPSAYNHDRSERDRDPRRQNSKTSSSSRREYRDLQAQHQQYPYNSRNPYAAQHYNQPLPSVPRQARHASSGSADFDSGGMVNPARAAAAARRS